MARLITIAVGAVLIAGAAVVAAVWLPEVFRPGEPAGDARRGETAETAEAGTGEAPAAPPEVTAPEPATKPLASRPEQPPPSPARKPAARQERAAETGGEPETDSGTAGDGTGTRLALRPDDSEPADAEEERTAADSATVTEADRPAAGLPPITVPRMPPEGTPVAPQPRAQPVPDELRAAPFDSGIVEESRAEREAAQQERAETAPDGAAERDPEAPDTTPRKDRPADPGPDDAAPERTAPERPQVAEATDAPAEPPEATASDRTSSEDPAAPTSRDLPEAESETPPEMPDPAAPDTASEPARRTAEGGGATPETSAAAEAEPGEGSAAAEPPPEARDEPEQTAEAPASDRTRSEDRGEPASRDAPEAESEARAQMPEPAAPDTAPQSARRPAAGDGEAPEASAAADAAAPQGDGGSDGGTKPSFDVVRVERSGETIVAGRAAPGARITVLENGRPIAQAEANQRGEFAAIPDAPLRPGQRQLTLRAEDDDGARSESERAVVIDVPRRKPAAGGERPKTAAKRAESEDAQGADGGAQAEAGDEPEAGGERLPLAVLVPREGTGSVEILQRPEGGIGIESQQLVLEAVQYTADGRIAVSGRARVGAPVLVYLNNAKIASARADADGDWSVVPDDEVPPGLHTLRVDQLGPEGRVQARVETPFANQPMVDELDDESFVVVQPGNNLWTIARRTYGKGWEYTLIYQANDDQIADPDLIYPGQVFVLPDEAGGGRAGEGG